MGVTSTDQVPRLLALVPYLQQHPDAALDETARVFGVTPRQLISDLNVLWFCGLPGGGPGDLIEVDMDALHDHGRIRLSNADFLARPQRFTVEEVMSLIVALRAVEEMAGSPEVAVVRSARAKLERVFGASPVDIALATGEEAIRGSLAAALARGCSVWLTYHGASRGAATRVLVDVAGLGTRDGYGYLTAWAHERGAWRTYRLDRIAGVEETDLRVGDHPPAPALDAGWLDARPDAVPVTLDLAPQGRWISEYHPTLDVTDLPDGGVRVRLLVADPAWFRRLLLRLGPAVRAVDPPGAAASAARAAAEALDAYDATRPDAGGVE